MPGSKKTVVVTGKETIGVEIGCGPKDYDKLNMDGASPVRTVNRKGK